MKECQSPAKVQSGEEMPKSSLVKKSDDDEDDESGGDDYDDGGGGDKFTYDAASRERK